MEMKRLQVENKPGFLFWKETKTTPSWSLKPMPELLPFCNKLMQTSSPLWQLNMYVKQLRTLQSISHLDGVHDLSDFTNMKTPPKPPADPLESMKAPLKPPPIDPKEAIKGHQAGDGIRSMEVLIGFFHLTLTFLLSDLQCVQNVEFRAVCEAKQVLHGLWNYCHQLLRWLPCLHEAPTPRARTLHSNWWQWPNVPHQKEIQVGLAWSNVRVYSLEEFTEWTMSQLVPPVVLKASKKHTGKRLRLWSLDYFSFSATLVFLHGLGDTGFGWAGALNTIRPDFLKVTCSSNFRE